MKKIILINVILLAVVTGCSMKKINTEYVSINIGDEKASVIAAAVNNDSSAVIEEEIKLVNTSSYKEAEESVKKIVSHLSSLETILDSNMYTFKGKKYEYYIGQLKCSYSSLKNAYEYIQKTLDKERKNSKYGNVQDFIYILREHSNIIFMDSVTSCVNALRTNIKI